MMSPETTLPMPFAVPDGGFLESHDDLFSLLEQFNTCPSQNPVSSGNSAGSIEPDPAGTIADERKRRRMISNRDSARRSRMRKQRHLEGLRNQVNRLKAENREFANRLAVVSNHYHLVSRENDRFRAEAFRLRQRLSDLSRFLITRQLQQQILFSSNEQIPQLIA